MKMNAVILLDVNDHFVKEVQKFLAEHDNPTEFSNAEINGLEISRGYVISSPIPQTEQVSSLSKTLLTQASKWIRKAATQGDSDAQNTLGLMYLKGEGVKKNLNIAKKWFKKAATLGHAQARQNLRALSH
jgi:TPR repeat protein